MLISLAACTLSKDKPIANTEYVNVDHGKLFVQKFGTGDPILIIHGGPGLDQSYLLPQMLELAKDHELIFYDQRGSGKSLNSTISQKYINLDQFTDDIEKLRLELGLKRIIVIGHSWGGLLAMNYAVKYPDCISFLILLNSAPANYKGQKAFLDEFIKRTASIQDNISSLFKYEDIEKLDVTQINDKYRALFTVYFYDSKNTKYLTLDLTKGSALSGFKVLSEMTKSSWLNPKLNLLPDLQKIKTPTLIFHGNQDVIPSYTANDIKKSIPNSSIIYLEYCGHFSYIEQPEQLFSAIRSFLNSSKK